MASSSDSSSQLSSVLETLRAKEAELAAERGVASARLQDAEREAQVARQAADKAEAALRQAEQDLEQQRVAACDAQQAADTRTLEDAKQRDQLELRASEADRGLERMQAELAARDAAMLKLQREAEEAAKVRTHIQLSDRAQNRSHSLVSKTFRKRSGSERIKPSMPNGRKPRCATVCGSCKRSNSSCSCTPTSSDSASRTWRRPTES